MNKLNKDELENIRGGSATGIIIIGILAIGTIIAGILDGYTRPLRCNE